MTRAKSKIRTHKKKISPYLIQYIDFGSFPGTILFTCGFSYSEIVKHLTKKKNFDWLAPFKNTEYLFGKDIKGFATRQVVGHSKVKEDKIYYFICMRDRFDFSNDFDHIALAHEIIHICTFNLKDMLDIVVENEAFAYTHTHISHQIYRYLRS